MFHLYLNLAYIIPNIYVFTRLNRLFIAKGYKIRFTFIYLILFAVYPLAGNLNEGNTNTVLQLLSGFAGYVLPFYLYLFLSVVLFDLFLLLNLVLKVVSKEKRKSFKFRFYTFSLMIILSLATVVGGVINLNTIRVSRYQLSLPKQNSDIEKLRVAFVADIHINQKMKLSYIEKFVEKVNELEPDLMLFGGDVIEHYGNNKKINEIETAFRNIKTKYGAYGVIGNHEFYGGKQNDNFFSKAGITILGDTIIQIDKSFYLAGRYDEHYRDRKTIGEIMKNFAPGLPVILMDHRPTQLHEVSMSPVDVQFSGHTHNGQLFPLNYIIHQMYELSWGYKKIGKTNFFVTSGLRLWGPPVKTAGKSEIILVDFSFE